MVDVELESCRRMRRSLAGIRDLDPAGVDARLAEIDREIARLQAMLGTEAAAPSTISVEIVPIGSALRAA